MNGMNGWLLGLLGASLLGAAGPGHASVPNTTCRLERQTRIDPTTLAGTVSNPAETYRFSNGKLYVSSPDRAEYIYNDVSEVEFGKRYIAGQPLLNEVSANSL